MFGAFLATFSFALSVVCAQRAARVLGGMEANFWRLVVALIMLGLWAHCVGNGLSGDAFGVFVLSGFIGIGVGDLALYEALPRLGSRLTVLLLQCLTTGFAIGIEWVWLGTRLTLAEICCGAVILTGVAMALRPHATTQSQRNLVPGVALTTIAAFGNATGMVLSRKAYAIAAAASQQIDGGTAAYQRVIGGLMLSGIFMLILKHRTVFNHMRQPDFSAQPVKERFAKSWPWVLANGALGMTIGVSCLQWALKTTPAGIVQSVIAVTPLVVIPLARLTEGERAGRNAWIGGLVAVAGTIALTWVHTQQ